MSTEYDRPTSVIVFGILNIVFGSLGLVNVMARTLGVLSIIRNPEFGAGYGAWSIVSLIANLLLSSSLLSLGIGLLKKTTWARAGCVVYAWAALGTATASLLITGAFFIFLLSPGKDPVVAAGLLGEIIAHILAFPYPILLLIFMRKERIREYFGT